MKKIILLRITIMIFLFASVSPALQEIQDDLPEPGNNKVAYFVFDSGGPDHFPLTSFSDEANIVVLFEGKLWELADSLHYAGGYITSVNPNYHYYSEILTDVRILQSRGIKVLMNVDDAASWSTSIPFTTYNGINYNYQQFAEFIKTCAIDSLHLDGISLDIEHGATGNDSYKSLLKEIGKYFGPLSSNSDSQMYIAAIYSGGRPGSVIGKSKDVAGYLNFVMDMAYFDPNYIKRFTQWADSIGSVKTMLGVLIDNNNLAFACNAASWQPSSGIKAGIMVYAANNLKSYTDSVFRSLTAPVTDAAMNLNKKKGTPQSFNLLQNYPNPFNPSTNFEFRITDYGYVTLKVYDLLGREVATLVNEMKQPGTYTYSFNASNLASGTYIYRLTSAPAGTQAVSVSTKKMTLLK